MTKIDEQIRIVLKNYDQFITTKQAISDIKALIANQAREARIDELNRVICHKHGFGKDSCRQIQDRIAELQSTQGDKE